jgi:hypothetical protein
MMHRPFKMESLALSRFGYLPVALLACSAVGKTASPRSDRDPPHYHLVLGVKGVNLENFSLEDFSIAARPATSAWIARTRAVARRYGTPRLKHASSA